MRVYDRLPAETEEEFQLFLEYLHQPPGQRSVSQIALDFGIREREVAAIAERNSWLERALAYDQDRIRDLERALASASVEARYEAISAIRKIMKIASDSLNSIDGNYLSIEEIKSYVDLAERLTDILSSLPSKTDLFEPEITDVLAVARRFTGHEAS